MNSLPRSSSLTPSRRNAMALAAAGAASMAIGPQLALADAAAVEAEIKKLYADKTPGSGRVKIDVPQIAENGLVVPINIEVESPMSETDYVKAVHIYADGNPLPGIASFRFTPDCGKAAASARMRLAQTQNIIAIAEMADGSLFSSRSEVKVTIGGCGG
ncbi:COG5501 Predicted secreted protein [Rhabdaerophilaceae bacterium]